MTWKNRHACLKEKTAVSGFDRHYIYHTAWAARIVAALKPDFHVDISSSLYFCSIVSAFLPVHFYEFRKPLLELSGLHVHDGNLSVLPFTDNSVQSLSCMHVVEHAGLGRYGDPLDPEGDLIAIAELKRVCAVGGSVLFVVPVGKPKICYNAHRIYTPRMIADYFAPLVLREFAFIGNSFADGPITKMSIDQESIHLKDGCGCFWFQKK